MNDDNFHKTFLTKVASNSDDDVEDICYWDGFIYYASRVEEERNIWKIRTDGSGRELVSSDSTYLKNSSINVSDGWIYYRNKGDNGYLYKMRTDGSGLQLLFISLMIGFITLYSQDLLQSIGRVTASAPMAQAKRK